MFICCVMSPHGSFLCFHLSPYIHFLFVSTLSVLVSFLSYFVSFVSVSPSCLCSSLSFRADCDLADCVSPLKGVILSQTLGKWELRILLCVCVCACLFVCVSPKQQPHDAGQGCKAVWKIEAIWMRIQIHLLCLSWCAQIDSTDSLEKRTHQRRWRRVCVIDNYVK